MPDDKTPTPDISSGRRRRAPTIDLKATKVASDPPEGAASAKPQAEEAATPPPESAKASRGSGVGGYLPPWPAVIGAAAGGALVIAGVWLGSVVFSDPRVLPESSDRLTRLEAQLQAISKGSAQAADGKAADDLIGRIGKIERVLAERGVAAPAAPDLSIARRLDAAEAAVKSLDDSLSKLSRRADENAALAKDARSRAEAIQTDATRRESETGSDRAMRLAIAALALRSAAERGDPFEAELAALKALAPDAASLAPLESFAAKGVPSPQTLASELSALIPALSPAPAETPPEGNFLERLQANAQRLVRIRPVDETAGYDAKAVVARAEIKARQGDIAGAAGELGKLPEPLRARTEPWIKKTMARDAALAASRRIASSALTALGKPLP